MTIIESTKGNILRGDFSLSHGVEYTGALSWDASVNDVDAALESLSQVNRVEVSTSQIDKYGARTWGVRFTENPGVYPPGAGNVNTLQADTSSMLETDSTVSSLDLAVVTDQQGSDPLTGTFTAIMGNAVEGSRVFDFNEHPDDMAFKLEELTTIYDVSVTRTVFPSESSGGWGAVSVNPDSQLGGYKWQVTFVKNPGTFEGETWPPGSGNIETLSVDGTGLSGEQAGVAVGTSVSGSESLSGNFRLSYSGAWSDAVAYDVSAADIKTQLDEISSIGEVEVDRYLALLDPVPVQLL